MRYEEGHKDNTRRLILDVASRKFRKEGISATGLAGVMKEAGLTNGAFYAHFKSKDDLVKQVLIETLDRRVEVVAEQIAKGATLEHLINAYLSPHHRDSPEDGCISASLLAEFVQQSKSVRKLYTEKIEESLKQLATLLAGSPSARHQKSVAVFALLIGTLQLARAATDESTSAKILKSGREAALTLIQP